MSMRSHFRGNVLGFLIFASLSLIGCASGPKPIPVEGSISAASDINPDDNGRASPVVIRIYQLRSAGAFQTSDFFTLYDQEGAALGKDLIAREELELQPGQSVKYKRDWDPETRYVGVLAAFRDIENSSWRSVAEIPEKKFYQFLKDNDIVVKLGTDKVAVSFGKH